MSIPQISPSHLSLLPADALPDDALRLHAARAVVEVREGRGHRGVERQQLLLTRLAVAKPRLSAGVEQWEDLLKWVLEWESHL